jgi:hypothetical protein
MKTINIATDYSETPGPRYIKQGGFSGEHFRDCMLYPALHAAIAASETLTVILDNDAGYGPSFLEEAFAGLIRKGISLNQIRLHLIIKSKDPFFLDEIEEFLQAEASNREKSAQ